MRKVSISSEEVDDLLELCKLCRDSDETSEWEKAFCVSIRDQLQKFGKRVHLSPRQKDILYRIQDKL